MSAVTLGACEPLVLASHLAMLGLGAILEERCDATVRAHWTGGINARPVVTAEGVTDEAVAQAVRAHAEACLPWLSESFPDAKGVPRALMSPRRGLARDRGTLESFIARRRTVIDANPGALAARFFGGLGEPSFWHRDTRGEERPDWAATRLDMQPRNSGNELVSQRLRPLGAHVAGETADRLLARLQGTVSLDTEKKGLTATGFAPPGPFDSVLAWCAFWGLAALPVAPRATSGGFPVPSATSARSGEVCWMPISPTPIRMARWRSLVADQRLCFVTDDGAQGAAARAWLAEQGVPVVVRFTFINRGTASASQIGSERGTLVRTRPAP